MNIQVGICAGGLLLFALDVSLAFQTNPKDSVLERGMKEFHLGRYPEAIRILQPIEKDSAANREAVFYLGMSYASMNDAVNARHYLREAVCLDSLNMGYRFQLARTLASFGEVQAAIDEYLFLVNSDTNYAQAYHQLGVLYYEQKAYSEAEGFLRKVLSRRQSDFLSFYYLGGCFIAQKQTDSAKVALAACLRFNPSFIPALTMLASVEYTRGMYEQALQLYSTASDARPANADLTYRKALCLSKLSRFAESIPLFKRAINLDSLNATYFAHLGYIYYHLQKYDSSVVFNLRATQIDNENPIYHFNLALSYKSLDSTQRAIDSYYRAIRTYQVEKVGEIYSEIGSLLMAKERYREALTAYQRVLQYDERARNAQYWIGDIYERLGERQNAVRSYQRYLESSSTDSTSSSMIQFVRTRLDALRKKSKE